ncbi:isoprenylcysteine carboxylmethyltransferase family protein [Stenotrophomonas sp. MH1]|uniref:Isoprenylcysteine carboxylmethyltransferase family protein n=1 Tax=Stenotrophomonas capsici TaxID=3110230 RepID=A0ABU5V8P6_9GAMM|nr:isoprenylcysteine carboxylmethyltransferase family protein [Stenotrophomonas sp. MH1]MEA5668885.1 isoprenylcysteine carboxylmethyltransferase family protein [Stenotrophomonas sp. MH1]
MTTLDTRLPPPIVLLLCGLLAWLCAHQLPGFAFSLPVRITIVTVTASAGVLLNLVPKLLFQRAGTTVNPLRPQRTTQLVTHGVYRFTRNPMYLGQALVLLAACLWLRNAVALGVVPVFIAYITRFQILPEERHLAQRFGPAFDAFRARTRRWL